MTLRAQLLGKLRAPTVSRAQLCALLRKNLDAAAHSAATSTLNLRPAPSEAQRSAGNYKKGHVRFAGLSVAIENPAGSYRRPEWPAMQAHYGYVKGTAGADGDCVDCFLRPSTSLDWDGDAYVINQVTAQGRFDEHKVMLGYDSQEQAVKVYQSHYPSGWAVGPVTTMSLERLREWLRTEDTTSPVAKAEWNEEDHPRDEGGKFASLDEQVAQLSAMSDDERDNLDIYGAGLFPAYVVWEAEKMMPKKDGSFKAVTMSNSFALYQEADAVVNVNGKAYLATKQEDPDDDADEGLTVWRFDDPRVRGNEGYQTAFADKADAVEEFKLHLAAARKIQASRPLGRIKLKAKEKQP